MAQRHLHESGIDPKRTEIFLLSLPQVLDASVWFSDARMMAHVTVTGDESITARKIQAQCMDELGLHQTPHDVFVIWANQLVA